MRIFDPLQCNENPDTCSGSKFYNNCVNGACKCGKGTTGTDGVCDTSSTTPKCQDASGNTPTAGADDAGITCKVKEQYIRFHFLIFS